MSTATAVRRVDEFIFLEGTLVELSDHVSSDEWVEIIPWLSSESVTKRKPKGTSSGIKGIPTLLDQFVVASKGTEDEDGAEDIIMNEDGTMVGYSPAR